MPPGRFVGLHQCKLLPFSLELGATQREAASLALYRLSISVVPWQAGTISTSHPRKLTCRGVGVVIALLLLLLREAVLRAFLMKWWGGGSRKGREEKNQQMPFHCRVQTTTNVIENSSIFCQMKALNALFADGVVSTSIVVLSLMPLPSMLNARCSVLETWASPPVIAISAKRFTLLPTSM